MAAHHFYDSDFAISDITGIHQHRVVRAPEHSKITRRYCGAVAHMTDGTERTLWYLIEDGMGLAGMGDAMEFCISGLDPIHAYGGRCRVLR